MKSLMSLLVIASFAVNPAFANTAQNINEQAQVDVQNLTHEDLVKFVDALDIETGSLLEQIQLLKAQIAEQKGQRSVRLNVSLKSGVVAGASLGAYVVVWNTAFNQGIRGQYNKVTKALDISGLVLLGTSVLSASNTVLKLGGAAWDTAEIKIISNRLNKLEAQLASMLPKIKEAQQSLK